MEELEPTSNPTDETAIIPADGEVNPDPDTPVVTAKPFYSVEELENLHPTAIDLEKVDPAARPIVAKTIKEYKLLQADHTKKSTELSKLKEVKLEETYFPDKNKNDVFRDYLQKPMKVIGDINAEISRWASVIPDDGAEEYRAAQKTIAQWQAIKDEFRERESELSKQRQREEVAEAKLIAELGQDAPTLMEYAVGLGYSERDFKAKPELREALKRTYKIDHAVNTAQKKEVKPVPQRSAESSGSWGGSSDHDRMFDDSISTEERISLFKKNRAA
jgi:hypothetical protein